MPTRYLPRRTANGNNEKQMFLVSRSSSGRAATAGGRTFGQCELDFAPKPASEECDRPGSQQFTNEDRLQPFKDSPTPASTECDRPRVAAMFCRNGLTNTASASLRKAFLCLALFALPVLCDAATLTATLDREAVSVGETATLSLSFEGGDPQSISNFEIPSVQIERGGVSRNFSIINGKTTSTTVVTYALTPTQPGDFTIPALQAKVGDQVLASAPLKFKAVKAGSTVPDAAGGDKIAFVKLFIP